MIQLTSQPINEAALLAQVRSSAAGAIVLFLGTTREFTAGKQTASLAYECYAEMAEKKLAELEAQARTKMAARRVAAIVHRLGGVGAARRKRA